MGNSQNVLKQRNAQVNCGAAIQGMNKVITMNKLDAETVTWLTLKSHNIG